MAQNVAANAPKGRKKAALTVVPPAPAPGPPASILDDFAEDPPRPHLTDQPPAAPDRLLERAMPGLGHNGVSEDDVRVFVRGMIKLNQERAELNSRVSAYRKAGKLNGFELGKIDAVIKMLEWTQDEIKESFAVERFYAECMGMPVGTQLELFGNEATPDHVREQLRWRGQGRIDGIAGRGKAEDAPDGCPPEHRQEYGAGWYEGQEETQASFLRKQNARGPLV